MIRAVIYSRVSSSIQAAEGVSLEAQRDMAERYCRDRGWSLVAEYQDVLSGRDDQRPRLRQLEADAKARLFEVVLVYRTDRLARSFTRAVAVMAHLAAVDVALVSMTEPLDLTGPMGKAIYGLLAGFAEQESVNIGLRVADAKRYGASRGVWQSNRAPTGYRYTGKEAGGARLDVDEDWAPVVRRVFALYVAGATCHGIARTLNDEGQGTPNGGAWYAATVRNMLVNPTYTGVVVYGRTTRKGKRHKRTGPSAWTTSEAAFPAIVDAATWEAAQARLAESAQLSPRQRYAQTIHPWSGLLRCAACGSSMTAGSGASAMYLCRNPRCTLRPSIPGRVLDGALIAALFRRIEADVRKAPSKQADAAPVDTGRQVKALEARIARAKRLALADVLTPDEARQAIAEAQAQMAALQVTPAPVSERPTLPADLASSWQRFTPAERGRFLRLLVAKVSVKWESAVVRLLKHSDGSGGGYFTVPIPRLNRPRRGAGRT